MNRQPSIHITQARLELIIRDYFSTWGLSKVIDTDEISTNLSEHLMMKARPFALDKRSINVTNQKIAKEVEKKTSNDKSGHMELAKIISLVRKDMRHKGVKMIDMNSPEYAALKRLTKIIDEFAKDFDMSFKAASVSYVTMGLSKISSFRNYVGKLCDMSESISLEFEAKDMIKFDKYKSETKRVHDIYVATINTKTGMSQGYEDNPTKYIAFMRVRELCEKYKIEPNIFIQAQFEGLAWTDSFPEPNQLVSDKAIERLNKYLYTKKIKLGKSDRTQTDKNLSSILNKIKNGEN